MGRLMPTECEHGRVIDWGDFGDVPERCGECDAARGRREGVADAEQAVIAAAETWADAPNAYVKAIYGGDLYDAVAALRAARKETGDA